MCFVFTCGEHEFSSYLQGYEGLQCRCMNCGNYSGHVMQRWPWFTFCFVPVLPLSLHRYHDIVCSICRFAEPLENRPDVVAQRNAGHEMRPRNEQGRKEGDGRSNQPGPNQSMVYG